MKELRKEGKQSSLDSEASDMQHLHGDKEMLHVSMETWAVLTEEDLRVLDENLFCSSTSSRS